MSDVAIQQQYNRAVVEWKATVDEFETAIAEAAEQEAKHKAARAKAIVRAKHDDAKAPAVLIEAMADADEEVGRLALLRLVKSANVDALKQRLGWHRALADNLRTQVVDERAGNQFMSMAGAGPGRTTFDSDRYPRGTRGSGHPDAPPSEPPRRPADAPQRPQQQRPAPTTPAAPPAPRREAPPALTPAAEVDEHGWRY